MAWSRENTQFFCVSVAVYVPKCRFIVPFILCPCNFILIWISTFNITYPVSSKLETCCIMLPSLIAVCDSSVIIPINVCPPLPILCVSVTVPLSQTLCIWQLCLCCRINAAVFLLVAHRLMLYIKSSMPEVFLFLAFFLIPPVVILFLCHLRI